MVAEDAVPSSSLCSWSEKVQRWLDMVVVVRMVVLLMLVVLMVYWRLVL